MLSLDKVLNFLEPAQWYESDEDTFYTQVGANFYTFRLRLDAKKQDAILCIEDSQGVIVSFDKNSRLTRLWVSLKHKRDTEIIEKERLRIADLEKFIDERNLAQITEHVSKMVKSRP